ncbi:hypothetical protein FOMG_19337 [Fusarium oxysporum f. sp. melonis 26406]|uniref:PD-(D/E)XK nuclease-like domain-containing protein n=1 Tax=Fusarium oxysporum f. sp. melonis 26406 TaxID=1089452 RepID=W9YXL7_FUSOX|nr:hypothetical protein FOMG_19337 [Fusarium oxysporum f. sp. melonis 26406]
MPDCRVSAWVKQLPESFEYLPGQLQSSSQPKPTNKRKAVQPPSPPPTISSGMGETPTGRKRPRLDPADPDRTPIGRPRDGTAPRRSPSKASSMSGSSASSYPSRSSSPLKQQIMRLRIDDTGFDIRDLKVDNPPSPEVDHLLQNLNDIGSGLEFLPDNLRDEILESPMLQGKDRHPWRFSFKSASDFEHLPGRIPSPQEVSLVYECAKDCRDFGHEEAGWNAEVHQRLLESVFREPGKTKGGLYNFTMSTTARPHSMWLPKSIRTKMIDFCIYVDLQQEEPESFQALESLCRTTLTTTVNHTDFQRLQFCPIVLSIETKGPAPRLDTAEVQMGVWHAAQWNFLRSTVLASLHSLEEAEKQADDILSRLPFIPGVIVQGHRWYFVLSTWHGSRTTFWAERLFGSTQSYKELYQVIAGLRHLTSWVDKFYLPWFRAHILPKETAASG